MAKHQRIPNWLIWVELTIFFVVLATILFCPSFRGWWWESVAGDYKHLFPQPLDQGWGGRSFISVATGLNLALVKLESWLKSLKDIRERWEAEISEKICSEKLEMYLADDEVRSLAVGQCRSHLQKAELSNTKSWAVSRHLAVLLTLAGFFFLFIQYSAGVLSLSLLLPVCVTAAARVFIQGRLMKQVDHCVESLAESKKNMDKTNPGRQSQIAALLKTGPQDSQTKFDL